MTTQNFVALAATWAGQEVIPAIAPEGVARWVFGFVGRVKAEHLIAQYIDMLPKTNTGEVDLEGLEKSFDVAFSAQPVLAFTIPQIPQLVAMGMGETVVKFTRDDAESLLKFLRGTSTVKEVQL